MKTFLHKDIAALVIGHSLRSHEHCINICAAITILLLVVETGVKRMLPRDRREAPLPRVCINVVLILIEYALYVNLQCYTNVSFQLIHIILCNNVCMETKCEESITNCGFTWILLVRNTRYVGISSLRML